MPDSAGHILFSADAVVSMDPAQPRVLQNAGVVVERGRVVMVGELPDLRQRFSDLPLAGEHLRGVLMPGFINAHTHLELSYLSSEALDRSHFTKWVSSLMASYPKPEQVEPTIRAAFSRGIAESLRAGVTTIGDISRHCTITRDEHCRLTTQAGAIVPRVVSFGEVVALGKMRGRLDDLLATAVTLPPSASPAPATPERASSNPAAQRPLPSLIAGVSPHAPYTIEGPALRKVVSRAFSKHAPVTMHLAELAEEADFLRDLSGPLGREWDLMLKLDVIDDDVPLFDGGPIRWAQRWGLIVPSPDTPPRDLPVLLAHVNYCSNPELSQLAVSRVSVAYCPRTHAYFGHPPHRYRDMLDAGINVCLGTDSLASNPDLSVLKEAQLIVQRDGLDPFVALDMITRRAAIAMGLGDHVGMLAPGKMADMQFIPLSSPEEPLFEHIVHAALEPTIVWMGGQRKRG